MADPEERLRRRVVERDELLKRALKMLESDSRVATAWLFGSLGRGNGDDLSDIDLFVVVKDEFCKEIIADRQDIVAQIGEPVLLLEAPQNAPPSGSYLMALYSGEEGPQHGAWIGAYVLMPDHLHTFVAIDDEKLVLPQWMKSLKNALSKTLRSNGIAAPHWQKHSLIACCEARNLIQRNGITFGRIQCALDL